MTAAPPAPPSAPAQAPLAMPNAPPHASAPCPLAPSAAPAAPPRDHAIPQHQVAPLVDPALQVVFGPITWNRDSLMSSRTCLPLSSRLLLTRNLLHPSLQKARRLYRRRVRLSRHCELGRRLLGPRCTLPVCRNLRGAPKCLRAAHSSLPTHSSAALARPSSHVHLFTHILPPTQNVSATTPSHSPSSIRPSTYPLDNTRIISIHSWNIRCAFPLQMSCPIFREDLEKYDINLLPETHLRPQQEDTVELPHGYSTLSRTRKPRLSLDKSWGGVAAVFQNSNIGRTSPGPISWCFS
jgi:hypothetical protein